MFRNVHPGRLSLLYRKGKKFNFRSGTQFIIFSTMLLQKMLYTDSESLLYSESSQFNREKIYLFSFSE